MDRKAIVATMVALISALGISAEIHAATKPVDSVEDRLRKQLKKERKDNALRNQKLRDQIVSERMANAWSTRESVEEAKLAVKTIARLLGIPERIALNGARGESSFNPFAVNGQYTGIYQLGTNFYPGPYLPDRDAAFHPWLNAIAAITTLIANGSDRQWEIDWRSGKPKPGYQSGQNTVGYVHK